MGFADNYRSSRRLLKTQGSTKSFQRAPASLFARRIFLRSDISRVSYSPSIKYHRVTDAVTVLSICAHAAAIGVQLLLPETYGYE